MISEKIDRSIIYITIILFHLCTFHILKPIEAPLDSEEVLFEIIFTHEPIPAHILEFMLGKSLPHDTNWPVQPKDLSYLTISHWGYDGYIHVGHMIVHTVVAQEVLDIFKELFDKQFPIERMKLIDEYDANDDLSMEANNTSAFCCRCITDKPGVFSNHSYGLAIDVNPCTNPYIKWSSEKHEWIVYPATGRQFVDLPVDGNSFPIRTESYLGIIIEGGLCCQAFEAHGWDWGGYWTLETHGKNYKDYQHFAKNPEDTIPDFHSGS